MSAAVGFDFGNESFVVAVATKTGIDIVSYDLCRLQIPALVSFGNRRRQFGYQGGVESIRNSTNTVTQIKRLIGRPFSDPELQRDLKLLPFSVTQGPDGFPLINARYLGEMKSFTPTQVLGMIFSFMKKATEQHLKRPVTDCCIGVPVYFDDLQKRAVLDAAAIAGLHPLKLIHETTATALAYGIYNTALRTLNEQLNVAFVDIGHSSMQVSIARFQRNHVQVLAHAFDRFLGGRDFDQALAQHFAEKFKADYNVVRNPMCPQFLKGCERLKKALDLANRVYVGLLDVYTCFLGRGEFEKICGPILERVRKPLEKALSDARLTVDDIYAVELVGLGSRIPAITDILKDFFGKEPRHSLHPVECVSKGCAFECAILSPTFEVGAYQVFDEQLLPISHMCKPLPEQVLQKAIEEEFQMASHDREIEETDKCFQALFIYVNNMKVKVWEKLYHFVTKPERETFLAQLQETEDWLSGEGEYTTMGVYKSKLEELKKVGDLFEQRYKEHLGGGRENALATPSSPARPTTDSISDFLNKSSGNVGVHASIGC